MNKAVIFAGALAFFLMSSTGAIVAANTAQKGGNVNAPKVNYVDENNDGVCDNAACGECKNTQAQQRNFVDENNDGVCDNAGCGECKNTQTQQRNFVDEDNDGVCDNAAGSGGIGAKHRGK